MEKNLSIDDGELTQEWKFERRKEYLKEKMTSLILDALGWMEGYDDAIKSKCDVVNLVFIHNKIKECIEGVLKIQKEIFYGRKSLYVESDISDEIKEVARNYPMEELLSELGLEARNGMYKCPFHEDRTPSAKLWHNKFYCFS